jgi:hypothetical protein
MVSLASTKIAQKTSELDVNQQPVYVFFDCLKMTNNLISLNSLFQGHDGRKTHFKGHHGDDDHLLEHCTWLL